MCINVLQEGGLLLEILAISLAEIPKCVFAHSEVYRDILLFPVWVNPSHTSPGTHLSLRIPALLELPKSVKEIAGNESVAVKVEETRAMTKVMLTVLYGSCADSDGDSESILDSDGDSCIRRKWHKAEK